MALHTKVPYVLPGFSLPRPILAQVDARFFDRRDGWVRLGEDPNTPRVDLWAGFYDEGDESQPSVEGLRNGDPFFVMGFPAVGALPGWMRNEFLYVGDYIVTLKRLSRFLTAGVVSPFMRIQCSGDGPPINIDRETIEQMLVWWDQFQEEGR